MSTATALYTSNPLTLNGAEKVWLDKSDGTLTGGCLSQALADLYKGTKGADLASAATVTLANATGNVVHVTGTTTITSFGNASAGLERTVIFDGILTLTHNGTSLILPGGASITTAAGDVARFLCDTTNNWRCLSYDRASGASVAGAAIADGDKGDITASSSGTVWTIDNDAVSNAKLANVNSQTIKGRTSASSGDPEDLTAAQAAAVVQGDGLTVDLCGFRGVPQNSQSAAYTLVASDAGKHIYHPSTDANARTYTIPANASVAFPIGTSVTFINETSQVISIAITSDTLVLAGTGATGTRSLAQYGVATAIKVTSTRWYISGGSALT